MFTIRVLTALPGSAHLPIPKPKPYVLASFLFFLNSIPLLSANFCSNNTYFFVTATTKLSDLKELWFINSHISADQLLCWFCLGSLMGLFLMDDQMEQKVQGGLTHVWSLGVAVNWDSLGSWLLSPLGFLSGASSCIDFFSLNVLF